jgi:hypothetical protein
MRSFIYGKLSVLALAMGVFSMGADAQTTKSKPKPLATPPPILTAAEIISRADDYRDSQLPVGRPAEKAEEQPTSGNDALIKELNERIKKLEGGQKKDNDEKQKRMLLNLDILTRAEQRSESLRKQLFEMIEKENTVKARLDQIEFDIRPEAIERTLQMAGSMKPEEVRDSKRKSLDAERRNLQALLAEIQNTRSNINLSYQKADQMVEKLRIKLEKEIEDSFLKDDDKDK